MDTLIQLSHLSEEDLLCLSEKAAENLAIAFDSVQQEALQSSERLKQFETDHQLEVKRLHDECSRFQEDLKYANSSLATTREDLSREESKNSELSKERDALTKKLTESLSISNELELVIKNLENDKESLNELLTRKINELELSNTELHELRNEASETRRLRGEALTQIEEAKTEKALLALREKRLEETSESTRNHNAWLEEELHKANDKLLSIRRDYTEKSLALESELASRKVELENAHASVTKLSALVKQLTESNEDHIEKLKMRTDELSSMDQLHANELEAQRRLTELFKAQASDAEKKCEEMREAVTSMQEMLKQGHEHVIQLQAEKAAFAEALTAEREELVARNNALTAELNTAKEIMDKFRVQGMSEEELLRLNPAVATTIAALKRGRNLMQIYTDYNQVVGERDMLKLDNNLLNEHVREIMAKLEEKGPVLRAQQEAFFQNEKRISELESQLSVAQAKLKEEHEIAEDQRRRSGYFQRQNARLKQSCKDLSIQAKTLLREVEAARGTIITNDGETESVATTFPDSSTDDADSRKLLAICSGGGDNNSASSSAAGIIGSHLVTYRGLAELQTQNARLLLVARDLAAQLEARESTEDALATQVSEVSSKVNALSGEVQVARLAVVEARSEAQLAARQRDTFKTLLQRHGISMPSANDSTLALTTSPQQRTSVSNTSMLVHPDTSGVLEVSTASVSAAPGLNDSVAVSKLEESLCSLHSEFKQYRGDKLNSDKVYTETIEKLRKEASDGKILNQKLSSQLNVTHEKFCTLEANVANYKQEIAILREMNARYTTSAAASDEALTALRETSARTADRLAESEVECRQLVRQLEQARANESRLSQELDMVRKQSLMHSQLMNQLQSIQTNLEHRENSERRQSERRIASLEEELTNLKRSSEETISQANALNTTLQAELLHARQALRSAEEEVAMATASAAEASKTSHTISTTIKSSHEESSSSSGIQASASESGKSSGEGPESAPTAAQLREVERECESLRVSLAAVRKQCDEFQQLGSEMEAHIASLTAEREALVVAHSAATEDAIQRLELLNHQLSLEKKERQDLVQENMRLVDTSKEQVAGLREELATAQSALRAADARRQEALAVEAAARTEVATHLKTAKEAREKYEMELRLHSQDVQLLMESRGAVEEARSDAASLRVSLESARRSLEQTEEKTKAESEIWEEERERLTKRLDEANQEVGRLQDQILKLTEQTVSLRKLLERSNDESFSSEEMSSCIKTSEDFTHLLEYLRRQKSIAETGEEAANAEVARLHLRTKGLESQVAELQAKLANERRQSEVRAETSQQHANIMAQIEQLNLLSESNRLLRQERETVRAAATRAEEQLAALQAELEPMRAQCQELEDAREVLVSEKRSLAEERDLWKERCSRLVETSKRMDPEEYKQACNARDELQTRLQATEEAKAALERETAATIASLEQQVQTLSSRLVQFETEGRLNSQKIADLESQCSNHQEELSKKQVTIMKLREIGRKYRQETDELKRQLRSTQEKEQSMRSTEDEMMAARADLLAAQATLHAEREHLTQLRHEIDRLQVLLEQTESHPEVAQLPAASPESLIGEAVATTSETIYTRLNHLLSNMVAEFRRLRTQGLAQSERLLRMQLLESQLTKSKHQCAELRAQLQSSTAAAVTTPAVATISSSSTEASNSDAYAMFLNLSSIAPTPDLTASAAVQQPQQQQQPGGGVATQQWTGAVPSWVSRTAATVQPVKIPPTLPSTQPTTAPSATTTSTLQASRQTAEIRPLPCFVATVVPTTTAAAAAGPLEPVVGGNNSNAENAASYLTPVAQETAPQPSTTSTGLFGLATAASNEWQHQQVASAGLPMPAAPPSSPHTKATNITDGFSFLDPVPTTSNISAADEPPVIVATATSLVVPRTSSIATKRTYEEASLPSSTSSVVVSQTDGDSCDQATSTRPPTTARAENAAPESLMEAKRQKVYVAGFSDLSAATPLPTTSFAPLPPTIITDSHEKAAEAGLYKGNDDDTEVKGSAVAEGMIEAEECEPYGYQQSPNRVGEEGQDEEQEEGGFGEEEDEMVDGYEDGSQLAASAIGDSQPQPPGEFTSALNTDMDDVDVHQKTSVDADMVGDNAYAREYDVQDYEVEEGGDVEEEEEESPQTVDDDDEEDDDGHGDGNNVIVLSSGDDADEDSEEDADEQEDEQEVIQDEEDDENHDDSRSGEDEEEEEEEDGEEEEEDGEEEEEEEEEERPGNTEVNYEEQEQLAVPTTKSQETPIATTSLFSKPAEKTPPQQTGGLFGGITSLSSSNVGLFTAFHSQAPNPQQQTFSLFGTPPGATSSASSFMAAPRTVPAGLFGSAVLSSTTITPTTASADVRQPATTSQTTTPQQVAATTTAQSSAAVSGKQKIKPIVWTDSPARNLSSTTPATHTSIFGAPPGTSGSGSSAGPSRRKNWGSFGSFGAPKGLGGPGGGAGGRGSMGGSQPR